MPRAARDGRSNTALFHGITIAEVTSDCFASVSSAVGRVHSVARRPSKTVIMIAVESSLVSGDCRARRGTRRTCTIPMLISDLYEEHLEQQNHWFIVYAGLAEPSVFRQVTTMTT